MFGPNNTPLVQLFQDSIPMPIVDEEDENTTYIGYPKTLGIKTSEAKWLIIKISTSGTVTKAEYNNGTDKFDGVWDNRITTTTYTR